MVKHTQTIHRLFPTSCLSVFDHFLGLALKGLTQLNPPQPNVVFHTETSQLFCFAKYVTVLYKTQHLAEMV